VTYIGAGIYEEILFRLCLFSLLDHMLRTIGLFRPLSFMIASFIAALAFATAHHLGPNGEPVTTQRFLFRVTAGIYFSIIYFTRGLGIAVGTHIGYDLLAGVHIS
jgi:membrane protease YdiL (CAAX protease family)